MPTSDFFGELINWSSFITASFCRICSFDPKISRHKDFLAERSSPFAILQIETAVLSIVSKEDTVINGFDISDKVYEV